MMEALLDCIGCGVLVASWAWYDGRHLEQQFGCDPGEQVGLCLDCKDGGPACVLYPGRGPVHDGWLPAPPPLAPRPAVIWAPTTRIP